MAVYKQPKSKYWWYKFVWNGRPIRESTKQTNMRIAEQMEAARRTQLAKGEVGIRDMARIPTLAEFAEGRFRPFVKATFTAKPKTQVYYENGLNNLLAFDRLAGQRIDEITGELIAAYVATRNAVKLEISSINGNSRFSGVCSISPTNGRSWSARSIAYACSKARTNATAFSLPRRKSGI